MAKYYSDSVKKATIKYEKNNIKRVVLKLNKVIDNDIIEVLDNVDNVNSYLKDTIREKEGIKKMKNMRDVKNEYGYVLRWINGGGDEDGTTYDYRFYLENVDTLEKIDIVNQEALDYISEKTTNAFKRQNELYDAYVGLFKILGINYKR